MKELVLDEKYKVGKAVTNGVEVKKALRYNENKLRWSLIDWKSLEPMVQQLMFGEKKYSRNNWKNGMKISSILDSLDRHKVEIAEDPLSIDEESGLPHAAGLLCNAMFLSYYTTTVEGKEKIIPEED